MSCLGGVADSECFKEENKSDTSELISSETVLSVVDKDEAVDESNVGVTSVTEFMSDVSTSNVTPIPFSNDFLLNSKNLNEEKLFRCSVADNHVVDKSSEEAVPKSELTGVSVGKFYTENRSMEGKDISNQNENKCFNSAIESKLSNGGNKMSDLADDNSIVKMPNITGALSPRSILCSDRNCVSSRSKKMVRFAVHSQGQGETVGKDTLSLEPGGENSVEIPYKKTEKLAKATMSTRSQSLEQKAEKVQESVVENDTDIVKESNQNKCSFEDHEMGNKNSSSLSSNILNVSDTSVETQEHKVDVSSKMSAVLKLDFESLGGINDRNVAGVRNSQDQDSYNLGSNSEIAESSSCNVGVSENRHVPKIETQLMESSVSINCDNLDAVTMKEELKCKESSQSSQYFVGNQSNKLTSNGVSDTEVCDASVGISLKTEKSHTSHQNSLTSVESKVDSTYSGDSGGTLSRKVILDTPYKTRNTTKSSASMGSDLPSKIDLKCLQNKEDSNLPVSCSKNSEDSLLIINVNSGKFCSGDNLDKSQKPNKILQSEKPSKNSLEYMQSEELDVSIKDRSNDEVATNIADKSCTNSVSPSKSLASVRSQIMSEIVLKSVHDNQDSEHPNTSVGENLKKISRNNVDAKKFSVLESPGKSLTSARSLILSEIALKSGQNSKDSNLSSPCKIDGPGNTLTSPRKSPIIRTGFPRIVLREKANKPRKIKRLVLKEKASEEPKGIDKSSEPEERKIDRLEMPERSGPLKSSTSSERKSEEVQNLLARMKNNVSMKTAEVSLVRIDESILMKYGLSSKSIGHVETNKNSEKSNIKPLPNVHKELKENANVNVLRKGKKRKISQSCVDVSVDEQSAEKMPSAKKPRFSRAMKEKSDIKNNEKSPVHTVSKTIPQEDLNRLKENKRNKMCWRKSDVSKSISSLIKENSGGSGSSLKIPTVLENLEMNLKEVRIHIAKLDPQLLLKYGIRLNEPNITDTGGTGKSSETSMGVEPGDNEVKKSATEKCYQSNEIKACSDNEILQSTFSVGNGCLVPKCSEILLASEKESICTSLNKLRQIRRKFSSGSEELKQKVTEDFVKSVDDSMLSSLEANSKKDIPPRNPEKNLENVRRKVSPEKSELIDALPESRDETTSEEQDCMSKSLNYNFNIRTTSSVSGVSVMHEVDPQSPKLISSLCNLRSDQNVKLHVSDQSHTKDGLISRISTPTYGLKIAVVSLSKIENSELLKYGINTFSKHASLDALEGKPKEILENNAVKSTLSKRMEQISHSNVKTESRKRKRTRSCDSSTVDCSLQQLLKTLNASDADKVSRKKKRKVMPNYSGNE